MEFVDRPLMEYFFGGARDLENNQWCPRWVEHPDAVHRLAAIYDEGVLLASAETERPGFTRLNAT
ncbi:DUF4913 domain-containing protein [Microbacterium sp. SL62]|uniref:DUF4913 domain-containing protein n=1 Tax=Microbacterium sp. SL62 TaxID=2995139 RepID=UPI003FA3D67F